MTPAESLIPVSVLRQLVRCDKEAGRLYWKERSASMFSASATRSAKHKASNWNSKLSGKEALTADKGNGYRHGTIFGSHFLAHRVVWALTSGDWPANQIDHINGNPADNRPKNLRDVTRTENSRNMAKSKRNSSGCTGVAWSAKENRWIANIVVGGTQNRIGGFIEINDAIEARKRAENELGFHENHGRTA